MNGSGIWIQRRHLRWLVVLLALLPLPPAVMLARLILDNAERDRIEAVDAETGVYREQLKTLVSRISSQSSEEGDPETFFARLHRIFGDEGTLVMVSPDKIWSRSLGPPPTAEAIQVEIPEGPFAGWTIRLDRVVVWPDYVWEFRKAALWRAVATLATVVLVAGVVWFAVNRGLKIDEMRSDLLSTISHEMRTPLASMRVLLETLESGTVSDSGARQEYFGLLLRENRRLSQLAENFLTYRRLERGDYPIRMEKFPLEPLIDSVWEEVVRAFPGKNAELVRIGGGGLMLSTDRNALGMVLRNLFENSMKYGGDPVRLEVEAETGPAKGRVRIAVSDSGPGVARAERGRVFAPFFRSESRLDDSGTGAGLGLAISRRLVRRLQGAIRIVPKEDGRGSCFQIFLPELAADSKQTEKI